MKESLLPCNRLIFVIILAFNLLGCDFIADNQNIETVKKSTVYFGKTLGDRIVESQIATLADMDGHVSWKTFRPEQYKENTDVWCVQVDIDKNNKKGKNRKISFQFLINKSSSGVNLHSITLDNRNVDDFVLMWTLGLDSKGIETEKIMNGNTAEEIWNNANKKLQEPTSNKNIEVLEDNKFENSYYHVTAAKTYFHSYPSDSARIETYLLKGDRFVSLKSRYDFVLADFTNGIGIRSAGWIKLSDITKE